MNNKDKLKLKSDEALVAYQKALAMAGNAEIIYEDARQAYEDYHE